MTLIETLATELERPRELSPRVLNYIGGTYGIDHDAIGAFLVDGLPKLEDYEIDLILSPVFTPKLADQAVFAELLGGAGVAREEWPVLIEQLVSRPTRAQLVTPDAQAHPVTLREVTIERYVHRLRLEATIPDWLYKVLDEETPAADRNMLKAIARNPAWESDGRRKILARYVSGAIDDKTYSLDDALQLLNAVENFKPADVADLVARIPRRQEALREQIDAGSGPKVFFDAGAQAMHGGERDKRGQGDPRLFSKQSELEFLGRLQRILEL